MTPGLDFAETVTLEPMTVAGAIILGALAAIAVSRRLRLLITSGSDGDHSGPTDPHKRGEAYDVRSHDFTLAEKDAILSEVINRLRVIEGAPIVASVGAGEATRGFYIELEHRGDPLEHFHIQVRRGHTIDAILRPLTA